MNNKSQMTNYEFHFIVNKLRDYFCKLGFMEVETQNRLNIMCACENPDSIATFEWRGVTYPLPQTGQFTLEYELLRNPKQVGLFCQTTSYRREKNPIVGRHKDIFSMFEFEGLGNISNLLEIERGIVALFELHDPRYLTYKQACELTDAKEINAKEEDWIGNNYGHTTFLTNFPVESSPFWSMKRNQDGTYAKVDVILHGFETIGSAERETETGLMMNQFLTISEGKYAEKLFELFGKDRVIKELEEFLALPMIPRFGGGIGLGRLARALRLKSI